MTRTLLIVTAAAVLLGPRGAAAQNALGDGTGLQRDTTSYGPNARPPARYDIMQSIRFRNAVVTGNVPMGKHFRADGDELPADYSRAINLPSPFEFRGMQASDTIFTFRRDSLFSGMAGTGIRGTEALQYQLAITTATAPPPGFAINMLPQRGGNIPSAGATLGQRLPIGKPLIPSTAIMNANPGDAGYDPRGRGLQDLRSTSSFRANQMLRTELLEQRQVMTGDIIGVTSSELRGVRMTKFGSEPERRPSPFAVPSLDASGRALSTEPIDTSASDLAVESIRTSYDDVMERMYTRLSEPEPGVDPDEQPMTSLEILEAKLATIRAQLSGEPLLGDEDAAEPRDDDPVRDDDDQSDSIEQPKFRFDPETIEMIRQTGDEVESFVAVGLKSRRDLYGEHMNVGQKLIVDKRFFDAEARFTAALGVRSGDPMASIGRVHAQLGAGMFESAAINLRQLLVDHPEVTGIRYSAELLPTRQRLDELVLMLRTRRDRIKRDDPGIGLLVSYIGFQSDDPVVLRQGLDIVLRADQDRTDEGLPPDPVSSLIVEVWTPRK